VDAPGAAPFAAARERINATIARDAADPLINPLAVPRLYDHGTPTARCVVLFHGFTNCPQQFEMFAKQLHAAGHTVYVPRIPQHGFADRLTSAIGTISAAEIEAAATQAAQNARALGRHVVAIGLSLGATMALWLAQTGQVDDAVGIAPFLMVPVAPRVPGLQLMRLLDWLPDTFLWWDPRIKERIGPPYAYPGFWTHGLAQCVMAGDALFTAATRSAPVAPRATLVINAQDPAVNNSVAHELAAVWKAHGAAYDVQTWTDLGKVHDVIDPTTYPKALTLTYPRLRALIDAGATSGA
jgi:alpha-beta hydrolase superfamily lysophospholipase